MPTATSSDLAGHRRVSAVTSRPRPLAVMAALLATVTLISAMALVQPRARTAHNLLSQAGVALNAKGSMTIVEAGADPTFLPDTRVIDPALGEWHEAADNVAEESRQRHASGDNPGESQQRSAHC